MIQILELFGEVKIKVSDDGRIFTLDHTSIRKNGRADNRKGKELKPSIDKYGYKHVVLSSNKIRKTYTVHQLVGTTYIENPEKKETINHKDGNKLNNCVDNLEWATQKEQKEHAIKHNLCNKNIEALSKSNKRKSREVIFRGIKYNSINEAKRKTGTHQRVIAKEGVFTNDNSNS